MLPSAAEQLGLYGGHKEQTTDKIADEENHKE